MCIIRLKAGISGLTYHHILFERQEEKHAEY